ncbi:GntR family transcriptional regulator [Sphaerisporangium krabiense]|uniref:GntR family transcriptional regulator/MocR family aminotransferase n=1 Tax=Sphaerisporangium krabiense TaxID=763782 RepID=A0A7W8Z704_9ACTN|nr:PLP-dependent aminotransferase family protein [Sphaerisporangium krabiense]MBB5628243.1 GntR family transcriptional regulator/MocR family aminotransferase [Sphaerisporangium krabiense]GII66238.1 GntR family transcriptional regulator [Sphaerisporangium krabiense]
MRGSVDLPLALDRAAPVPLAVQLTGQLREGVRTGMLRSGERLPSSRALARLLGVSRTVVTEAFQQLYAEGWLEGHHGSGTYVAHLSGSADRDGAPAARREPPAELDPWGDAERPPAGVIDLRPGRPWVLGYDEGAWRRAWRLAGLRAPAAYVDPYGHPRLRALLAGHLRRARAIPVGPENVMVTRGTGNGLDLVAAALLRPGDGAGVEEPGYRTARHVLAARGGRVTPCPVDEQGVVVDGLPEDLCVLYTTPAHQYPLGGRLPIARRERLLAWARRTGATVLEDDYDGEFRYDVAPLPALYGLDPERVVLLGTLSKSLAPDVGIGWLVAAPALLRKIAAIRRVLGDRTPGPVQEAVSILLERGDLDRHLRRMRLEYARRRAAIVDSLGSRARGDSAGLHVFLGLPAETVGPLVAEAAARGVLLDTTERHHHGPVAAHGLVIGYGSASLADVRKACEIIRDLLGETSG